MATTLPENLTRAIALSGNKMCPKCQRIYHSALVKTANKTHERTLHCPYCLHSVEVLDAAPDIEIVTNHDEEYWGIGFFEGKFKPLRLFKDGQYQHLDEATWLHNILFTQATELLHLSHAVEELEHLMNQVNIKETTFQDFFERNPTLLLNYEYKHAHLHIILSREEGSLIPDFMLEPLGQNTLCDILDLKLPTAKIFVPQKNRERFSAAVFDAYAQLREYNNYFEQSTNRDLIYQTYRLKAYKPKMIVVMGRRCDTGIDPLLARRIETDVPHLILRTYDDILERAKSRLNK